MRFSLRQILASAAGAVVAALIASSFGVTGTIIGVAIGSMVATTATALVSQSIERGQKAVRQVVQTPSDAPLLRRLGSTGTPGVGTQGDDATASTAGAAETVAMESAPGPMAETERLEISVAAGAPATERLRATSSTPPAAPRPPGPARTTTMPRFSWKAIAATVGVVFLLALGFITAIELISGKPLSSIFGGAGSGTSVNDIFGGNGSPRPTTPTTTPPTTSTTTSSTSTSTTASTSSTTTTTTGPSASSTTTVAGSSSSGGSPAPGGSASSTTTTRPRGAP